MYEHWLISRLCGGMPPEKNFFAPPDLISRLCGGMRKRLSSAAAILVDKPPVRRDAAGLHQNLHAGL